MIANCGKDERGAYSGGQAGDQTGGEYALINWYNRPWNCVLRHPDAKVRNEIARLARNAAQNNMIGYDQNERLTFWNNLAKVNFESAAITTPCEADCSSSTAAIIKATGYRLGDAKLKTISHTLTTYNMRSVLRAAGFDVLTDSKYLNSASYLLAGDILLNDSSHAAINVTNGSYADTSYGSVTVPETPQNPVTSPTVEDKPKEAETGLPTTTDIKQGDLVSLTENAVWWTGATIPDWVKGLKWYVMSINGIRAVLGRSEDGKYNVVSPIHAGYLKAAKDKQEEKPAESTNPVTMNEPAGEKSTESAELSGTYVVQRGDTLWGIAVKWCGKGWKYTEIQKVNGLKSINIYQGQVLKLPEKE